MQRTALASFTDIFLIKCLNKHRRIYVWGGCCIQLVNTVYFQRHNILRCSKKIVLSSLAVHSCTPLVYFTTSSNSIQKVILFK